MQEELIIKLAKTGDRVALKQLYDHYSHEWFSICLRYCSNRPDAQDVMQNAVVKILDKMRLFDSSRGSFGAWSAKIVVNENLQFLRQKRHLVSLENLIHEPADAHEHEDLASLSAEALMHVIQKLPTGYRTIFNLYVVEGYSHQEIANILGIKMGTSKSQLSKAKQMIRRKIELAL